MGKVIPVTVRHKIATAPKDALYVCGNSDFTIRYTTYEGGNEAHNNMLPYLGVNMWKRVG